MSESNGTRRDGRRGRGAVITGGNWMGRMRPQSPGGRTYIGMTPGDIQTRILSNERASRASSSRRDASIAIANEARRVSDIQANVLAREIASRSSSGIRENQTTSAQEEANSSLTSSTTGELDQEDDGTIRYEPIDLHPDSAGHLGEVLQKSKVTSAEALSACAQLSGAMATVGRVREALNTARESLIKASNGAAGIVTAADKETMRRKYRASSVGEEINRLFRSQVLDVERGGRRVGDVERTLMNEMARLRSVEQLAQSRERKAVNNLANMKSEIRKWADKYDRQVNNLRTQLKRGESALQGFWPEQFPSVELPKAISEMDCALEVLQWITSGDDIEESEEQEDSDAGWVTGPAVVEEHGMGTAGTPDDTYGVIIGVKNTK